MALMVHCMEQDVAWYDMAQHRWHKHGFSFTEHDAGWE